MNIEDIKAVKKLLSTPQKIVIVPHKNPDGDAIGSTLGLLHYLKQFNHTACVIAPNDSPSFLKWIPGSDQIICFDTQEEDAKKQIEEATLIFTLDFNDFGRVGNMQPILEDANATFIMIDHHQQPSSYAKVTYSDTSMSSTCEMVYNFIQYLDGDNFINSDIANCLYTGIMTDTGSFRFSSTTSTTHKIIANLIEKGANNAQIHNNIYDTNSTSRLQLLGCALKNMVVLEAYNTAYISLTQKELNDANYKKGDTEGFVNYGLSLDGIRFAVIFIESGQEGFIKMSLRSQGDFSVNEFARAHFNGGGHNNAAGGRSDDNMHDSIQKFVDLLPTYQQQLIA